MTKTLDLINGQVVVVERPDLFPYRVDVGARGNPRISFGCMASSSFAAWEQHICLAEPGESVRVVPVGRDLDFPIASLRHEVREVELREVRRVA